MKRVFSLIEIIIVSLVLVIVMALMLNRLSFSDPSKTRDQLEQEIQKAFANAKLKASVYNQIIELRFVQDKEKSLLKISEINNFENHSWTPRNEFVLPEQIFFDAEHQGFVLYPDGESYGENLEITFRDWQLIVNLDRLNSQVFIDEKTL